MYLTGIFTSLFSSFLILTIGNKIGKTGTSILSVFTMLFTLLISLVIFYEVALTGMTCSIVLFKWLDVGIITVYFGFLFDTITVIMFFIVCAISILVHIYSIEYMSNDPSYIRFMAYLLLFTFFMLFLVTSDNLIQMFIGWEGVGLSSYLLISFWYTRILANKAAIKAMLINRIGDLCLFIAISLCFCIFLTSKYTVIFSLLDSFLNFTIFFLGFNLNLLSLIGFFLFVGAMGKSAQIGLHIWLPDAMEGPTPVSALIHAATMVTAGVFLTIRFSFLYEYINNILLFIGLVGGFTCFFAAIVGSFQFDIKKIVAYSTCSQLGYMFFSCSLSNYNVALFHLFNHAFFKALLFLSMGSIIHAMLDEQDFRRMGGLSSLIPFTYSMVFIGTMSLLAMPYLTGYYSKDFLLEFTIARYDLNSLFLYLLGIMSAFFTAFYSIRLIYWVFLASPNFYKSILFYIHEPKFFMSFAMFFLSICSIFFGYFFYEGFIGIGSSFWDNSIYISLGNYSNFDAEFGLVFSKFLPLCFSCMGILFFYFTIKYYRFFDSLFFKFRLNLYIYRFANKAMMFDYFFIDKIFFCLMKLSYFGVYKFFEKGIIELIGPASVYLLIEMFARRLIFPLNIGLIYFYLEFIIVFILYLFIFSEILGLMQLFFGFSSISFFLLALIFWIFSLL